MITLIQSTGLKQIKRSLMVLIGFVFIPILTTAQNVPFKHFEHQFLHDSVNDQPSKDWALDIVGTKDGGYIVAGFSSAPCGNGRMTVPSLVKLGPHLEVEWAKTYTANQPCGYGYFRQVIIEEEGFIAIGRKYDGPANKNRVFINKVDFNGNPFSGFPKHISNPNSTEDLGESITKIPGTDDYAMIGLSTPFGGDPKIFFRKLDENLNPISNTYQTFGSGISRGSQIVATFSDGTSPDGIGMGSFDGFVLTGNINITIPNDEMILVVRLDTDGDFVWDKTINSFDPTTWDGYNYSKTYSETGPCQLTKVNADRASSLIQNHDGNIVIGAMFNYVQVRSTIVCGNDTFNEFLDADAVLINIDIHGDPNDGEIQWIKNISHFSGQDFYITVRQTFDGGFATIGTTADASTKASYLMNFFLVKTDDDGDVEWRHSFLGPSSGSCGFGLHVDKDGRFAVAGNNYYLNDNYEFVLFYSDCQPNLDFDIESVTYPSNQEVWNTNKRVADQIIVQSGVTFIIEDAVIEFADTRKINNYNDIVRKPGIKVEPGGHLWIKNSTLRGIEDCFGFDQMWEGIQVIGNPAVGQLPVSNQGRVTLEGSIIQDALAGVRLDKTIYNSKGHPNPDGSYGGGRITSTNSTFTNCRKSVEFSPYHLFRNTSWFNLTTFETTGPLVDHDFTDVQGRGMGNNGLVTLARINGVRFNGCTFRSTTQFDEDLRGDGIASWLSGYFLNDYCHSLFFPCDDWAGKNNFHDLKRGIYAAGTGSLYNYITVSRGSFSNNREAITLMSSQHSNINRNTIRVPSSGTATITPWGIRAWGTSGSSYLLNNFHTLGAGQNNYGQIISVSTNLGADVEFNDFHGTRIAFQADHNNRALYTKCNEFTAHDYAFVVQGTQSVRVNMADQGTGCTDQDERPLNRFWDNCTGTGQKNHILSTMDFNYYENANNPGKAQQLCVQLNGFQECSIDEEECNYQEPGWDEPEDFRNAIQFAATPTQRLRLINALTRYFVENYDDMDSAKAWLHENDSIVEHRWILVSTYFDEDNYEEATDILNTIDIIDQEEQDLHDLFGMLMSVPAVDRDLLNYTTEEMDLLWDIANNGTLVSSYALALIGLATGERHTIDPEPLPAGKRIDVDDEETIVVPVLKIHPNPAGDAIYADLPEFSGGHLEIMDITGRIRKEVHTNNGQTKVEVNVSDIPAGLYFVRYTAGDRIWVNKLMITR